MQKGVECVQRGRGGDSVVEYRKEDHCCHRVSVASVTFSVACCYMWLCSWWGVWDCDEGGYGALFRCGGVLGRTEGVFPDLGGILGRDIGV